MGHKHGRRGASSHGNIQCVNPILTDWAVPFSQIDALPIGMAQFPKCLPMLWSGVANTW